MSSFGERWTRVVDRIRADEARIPSHVSIPAENVEGMSSPAEPFESNKHYFEVVVKEIYLRNQREWLSRYDPMVFALTEFLYDGKHESVPFVVGPALLGEGREMPEGMLFSNTRVAGIHPYRGDRFALTVIFYRVERRNYAKDVLRLVETASGALDFASALVPYLKLADVVVQGVDTLLGFEETVPLLGSRAEFRGGRQSSFVPSMFALIDEEDVDPASLGVRGGRLVTSAGEPFRRADYVLFSIEQLAERDDETALPFNDLWERVVNDAMHATNRDAWKSAKGNLLSLQQTLLLSPDLTESQAESLADEYERKTLAYRARAQRTVSLSSAKPTPGDAVRQRTSRILDLE